MRKEIKLAAEDFGIKVIGKFLCFGDIADFDEGIIIHLVTDAVFIKDMFHHFAAIDVDLYQKREPCLLFLPAGVSGNTLQQKEYR